MRRSVVSEYELDRRSTRGTQHVSEDDPAYSQSPSSIEAELVNPFRGKTVQEMEGLIQKFMNDTEIDKNDWEDYIRKGAYLAQNSNAYAKPRPDGLFLKPQEKEVLEREHTVTSAKWNQPFIMYALIGCCSMAAATQGWDETAVNQAQLYYLDQFNIKNDAAKLGLTNAAPYLGCAVIGCWLTDPMNKWFGRRGTIFISCLISSLTCLWQGFTTSWWQLFIARFMLGLGIGPKSATVPIYGSECAPKQIRGALVMQWQMWTAFGIMLGILSGVVFGQVTNRVTATRPETDLRWRLIIASPMVLPLIVCLYVFTLPESPRWLLMKAKRASTKDKDRAKYYQRALASLEKLRTTKLEAARDVFLIDAQLSREIEIRTERNRFYDLFVQPRNRHAIFASLILMFFQQQCGVNVLAFYSSLIFNQAGFTPQDAEKASMGFGIINFVFAIPAVFMIDTVGRRNLLLATFPFMSLFQFLTGAAFQAQNIKTRKTLVTLGMYLFAVAYSPGEGPVPFLYASESQPMYVREIGMSLNTAVLWIMNFMLSLTFPFFLKQFTPTGAFGWYGAWCIVGWFCILFFVYETAQKTLEELDASFSISTKDHMKYGWDQLLYVIRRFVFMRKYAVKPKLPIDKVQPMAGARTGRMSVTIRQKIKEPQDPTVTGFVDEFADLEKL